MLVVRAWAEEGEVRVRVLASGAVRGVWLAASVPDAARVVRRVLDQLAADGDTPVMQEQTPMETRPDTQVEMTSETPD